MIDYKNLTATGS